MMAIDIAAIGVVVGIVLGLRYKVLVLVPAVMFAMISAIMIGVTHADRFWSIVLMAVELIAAVQLGYLAGTVTRTAIAAIFPPWKRGRDSDHGRNSHTEIIRQASVFLAIRLFG
jgi:NADH:ubiquinone oxidoreductase subunit 6 (subunit J)